MRFVSGPPPPSRTLDPIVAGWMLLREPASRSYTLISTGMSLPFVAAALALLFHGRETWRPYLHTHPAALAGFLLLLLLLVPVHELVHAIAYGCGLHSPHLIAGCWLRRGLAYVLYDAPLPRRGVLIMLAAPFVVLTVVPLLALPMVPAENRTAIAFFAVLHAGICTGDFATFTRLIRVTPPEAWIHNQGWKTYWRADHRPSPT